MLGEKLKLSDFDYRLPKALIAQYPCAKREDSRLLVLERDKAKIAHKSFTDIIDYFSPGDCLVLNNTKVIYARIIGRREKTKGKQEIFLLENLSKNTYRVLAKPAKKLTVGTKLLFDRGDTQAEVLIDQGMSKIVKFNRNGNKRCLWQDIGLVPLPPYIKREAEDLDKQRYQTVYATEEGATAAPTAGLHFTKELLQAVRDKGVNIACLTLHVSYGTFAPVRFEDITKHKMHKEYFILPQETKRVITQTRAEGKKVFAVGTTSVRVLETCAGRVEKTLSVQEKRGWTDLFVYPPYRFRAVDCLLTNFHFPKSTLLMLVSAFVGKELLFEAYQKAIEKKYRFFSYGDAMLIL
ncbi:MAG: tRNA preQ1(34) S-adenosylmethionine ribosyltransferase-isomerase QueA [Omnitrophica bacterium]|nr:tRNA preQ1(34) S-adenosylmethionine ribosyltransferase-isomerase QueA [Candidatus Omnitrophota bacterium]